MINDPAELVSLLDVRDRSKGDSAEYPNDDLAITLEGEVRDAGGPTLKFLDEGGTPSE